MKQFIKEQSLLPNKGFMSTKEIRKVNRGNYKGQVRALMSKIETTQKVTYMSRLKKTLHLHVQYIQYMIYEQGLNGNYNMVKILR